MCSAPGGPQAFRRIEPGERVQGEARIEVLSEARVVRMKARTPVQEQYWAHKISFSPIFFTFFLIEDQIPRLQSAFLPKAGAQKLACIICKPSSVADSSPTIGLFTDGGSTEDNMQYMQAIFCPPLVRKPKVGEEAGLESKKMS